MNEQDLEAFEAWWKSAGWGFGDEYSNAKAGWGAAMARRSAGDEWLQKKIEEGTFIKVVTTLNGEPTEVHPLVLRKDDGLTLEIGGLVRQFMELHKERTSEIGCGQWEVLSAMLDGEKLPASINAAIYGLCAGTHVVTQVENGK